MDVHQIAQIVRGPRNPLRLRQAEVVAVNGDGTVDVTLAGDATVIAAVVCFADVTPVVGGSLWLLTDGVDLIGIGVT